MLSRSSTHNPAWTGGTTTGGGTGGGTGGTSGTLAAPSGFTRIFTETFDTLVAEGSMFAANGDHAKGLGAYASKWCAETYLTTYGTASHGNTGDYYGTSNMSVVSGIAGATGTGNVLQMRLNPNDGTGKKVGACPFPNISGTPGSSASASAQLYGGWGCRLKSTSSHGWKTAFLAWAKTWSWTLEMDFPEGSLDGTIGAFNHYPNDTTHQDAYSTSSTFTSWHTCQTLWTSSYVKFILDGVTIGTSTHVPHEPAFWQLQTENSLSGGASQPTTTGYVYVDEVAVYSFP